MNINDVKFDPEEYKGKDRLAVMFEKQDELRTLYKIPILSLDVPADQSLAREFAWNTVEELSEAMEVATGSKDHTHLLDEVADATAFYLELLLMCGFVASDMKCSHTGPGDELDRWFNLDDGNSQYKPILRREHSTFVEKLALAINNLKNRKWRKTHVQTNKFIFKQSLWMTFLLFIRVVKSLGVGQRELFESYMKKYQVNLFRIQSKY